MMDSPMEPASAYLRDISRLFRNYKKLGDTALAQVPDENLQTAPHAVDNSVAVTVKHISGNLRSRFTDFLTSDGEKPDRNRDGEFELAGSPTRGDVVGWWESGWATALAAIDSLTPADLTRTVYIRGEAFLVLEALNRSITHTAYHVGQIVYLARHFAGDQWKTPTIPKGKSAEFAKGTYKTK